MAKRIAHTLSIMELLSLFATESDAVTWFEEVRWNGTPTCTHCGNTEHLTQPKSRPDAYWCPACQQRFTVRMGTVMESSRIPLQKWAVAMYYVLTARKGISSKELKVTQKTAWFLLQRIREACQREEFKLDLIVEVDEVYIGGKNKNRHLKDRPKLGHGMSGKQAVLGMRQRRGPTKALPIAQTDMATLYPIIEQHVEAGAFVCTDDHGAYRNLNQLGYQHPAVAHSAGEYVKECAHSQWNRECLGRPETILVGRPSLGQHEAFGSVSQRSHRSVCMKGIVALTRLTACGPWVKDCRGSV